MADVQPIAPKKGYSLSVPCLLLTIVCVDVMRYDGHGVAMLCAAGDVAEERFSMTYSIYGAAVIR
jgi:hypothetical protein